MRLNLPPESKHFLNNFGFGTPIVKDPVVDHLSHLLAHIDTKNMFQTLGGCDTVIIPTESPESELSLKEELFHIEQLRTHASGYHLENLKRNFVNVVHEYIKGKLGVKRKPIKTLSQRFAEYKFYNEAARLPLELQIRVRFSFYLGLLGQTSLDKEVTHFLIDKMSVFCN